MWLFALLRLALGLLALRGVRWAYAAFVALGLFYFPAKVGFRLAPRPCQLAFDIPLAVHSLTNYAHVVLFALFFVMTSAQFRPSDRRAFFWSAAATLVMGALVEVAQGVTGEGNCRLRDLIPDSVGILVGSIIVLLLKRVGWRPRPTWSLAWWRDTRQQRDAPDAPPRSHGR
jgi:VanZ family protein